MRLRILLAAGVLAMTSVVANGGLVEVYASGTGSGPAPFGSTFELWFTYDSDAAVSSSSLTTATYVGAISDFRFESGSVVIDDPAVAGINTTFLENAASYDYLGIQTADGGSYYSQLDFYDTTNSAFDGTSLPGALSIDMFNYLSIAMTLTGEGSVTFEGELTELGGAVVPVPAAVGLGLLGLGMVGWIKRRAA
jgi:hypothetical protein